MRPTLCSTKPIAPASVSTRIEQAPRGYGDPAGLVELREAIAHWIARSRGLTVTADQIIVTSGAQHAIDLIMRLLVQPSDIVALDFSLRQVMFSKCSRIGTLLNPKEPSDKFPRGFNLREKAFRDVSYCGAFLLFTY